MKIDREKYKCIEDIDDSLEIENMMATKSH